jgi:carbon storage regulator CsrA
MLVLTRRKQEQVVIRIGDTQVVVRILKTGGGRVRLGVVAPRDVPVRRVEGQSR